MLLRVLSISGGEGNNDGKAEDEGVCSPMVVTRSNQGFEEDSRVNSMCLRPL